MFYFYDLGFGRRTFALLAAVAVLGTLAGCTGRGGAVPYAPANFGAPDADTVSVSPAEQVIGPLDKIKIDVFQVPELSGEFRVDAQGKLQYPLLGQLEAQGQLPGALARSIAQRLDTSYLTSPNVQVSILEQTEQTITVDGSVREPGVVPIRGTTTLMRAVALAKGASEDANLGRVVVFRTINGERMAAAFDLRSIRRAEMEDPRIYGNDIIVVDGSKLRGVWREIIGTIPLIGYFAPVL